MNTEFLNVDWFIINSVLITVFLFQYLCMLKYNIDRTSAKISKMKVEMYDMNITNNIIKTNISKLLYEMCELRTEIGALRAETVASRRGYCSDNIQIPSIIPLSR
jgi:hypothetical protein